MLLGHAADLSITIPIGRMARGMAAIKRHPTSEESSR
jgi:hypothetical protein